MGCSVGGILWPRLSFGGRWGRKKGQTGGGELAALGNKKDSSLAFVLKRGKSGKTGH